MITSNPNIISAELVRANRFMRNCPRRFSVSRIPGGILCAALIWMMALDTTSVTLAFPQSSSESFDRARLIVLAPNGPVLADLRISVSGLPYRQWVGKYLAQQLDVNRSRSLSTQELELLSVQLRQLLSISSIDDLPGLAADDPQATSLATDQFAEWMRNRLPKSFFISALPKSADDAVRISSLLDTDLDGSISADELKIAPRTLRFRDLDDDQTYSVSELMPYRDPRTQDASLSPDAANLPFLEVTDDESAATAAVKLIHRYGHDGVLSVASLRLPTTTQTAASQSMPDNLSQDGLARLLTSDVAHLVVEFKLSDKANRSDVTCMISQGNESFCTVLNKAFGSVRVAVDSMPINIVARGGGANNRAYLRGFLGQNFLMSDGDKNQYLDEGEFAGLSGSLAQAGVNADFRAVDINNDAMLVRDELFGFVDREIISTSSRIEVTVEQDGKTMFGLMDTNKDRRLSPRELAEAIFVLQPYDLSGDGRFADEELGIEYNLTIGLGRPEVRRNNVMNTNRSPGMMNSGDAILPGQGDLEGPEWFRRMDRNRDGDVSRREFIGTAAMFAELDQNGDSLIAADEASSLNVEANTEQ